MSETVIELAEDDGMCVRCRKRPASLEYVSDGGGAMSWVHGAFERICSLCLAKAALEYSREQLEQLRAGIPKLETDLAFREGLPEECHCSDGKECLWCTEGREYREAKADRESKTSFTTTTTTG